MGDAEHADIAGSGGISAIQQSPMSFNIIGNGERFVVDPSLQPFISLKENNPVGLTMPVEVPVSSHLLQNNNILTTAMLNPHNLESSFPTAQSQLEQKMLGQSPKKHCPLEMSIKAADLDLEFQNESYVVTNGVCSMANGELIPMMLPQYPSAMGQTVFHDSLNGDTSYNSTLLPTSEALALTLQTAPIITSGQQVLLLQVQPQMTDPIVSSQPSPLMVPPPPVSVPLRVSPVVSEVPPVTNLNVPSLHHTAITHDECTPPEKCDEPKNVESLICEVDESEDSLSSLSEDEEKPQGNEEAVQPLVLKIRKLPAKSDKGRSYKTELERKNRWVRVEDSKANKKTFRSRNDRSRDRWSASDDETLAKVVKQKLEDDEYELNKEYFRRAPKCCSRHCHVKIQPKYQEIAFRTFLDYERRNMGDTYLATCVSLKPTETSLSSMSDLALYSASDSEVDDMVSREIAEESNGNQSLSDEIQNAIRESLKDQESVDKALEKVNGKDVNSSDDQEAWLFYLVINNRLKSACLKLILSVLRIPQSRVDALQRRILQGEQIDRIQVLRKLVKAPHVWPIAKMHIDSLSSTAMLGCLAQPPHRCLVEPLTQMELFEKFREFYAKTTGKELTAKFETYRRVISSKSDLVFPHKAEEVCSKCKYIQECNSGNKARAQRRDLENVPLSERQQKEPRKRRVPSEQTSNESDADTAQKIKTRRKTGDTAANGEKHDDGKKERIVRRKRPKKGQRGDVFSLMLLHLKTVPSKKPDACVDPQGHKYFDPAIYSPQILYDEYRKFFLKETNSELGLRYQLYESLLSRNRCVFDVFEESSSGCPRCSANPPIKAPVVLKPVRKKSENR